MKITPEIYQDWAGPDGYSDIANTSNCRIAWDDDGNGILYMEKSISSDGWSITDEARPNGHRGRLGLIPQWIQSDARKEELKRLFDYHHNRPMPPPLQELDEILLAQELIQKG